MGQVPVVDIEPFLKGNEADKQKVAETVDRICREMGFLVITGHGVVPSLQSKLDNVMTSFFEQPREIKARWAVTPENFRGYRGPNATALAKSRGEDSPPDLMERFTIGQFDLPDADYYNTRRATLFKDNRWPDVVLEFEATTKRYYREAERLAADLMRLFAVALGLPERYFEPFFDRHISLLVTNYYPPQPEAPVPGQLRAGAHTDYGSLTVLLPIKSPGGLQVQRRDGSWEDVVPVPGSYVINIGDLMAQWTNDRWVSNVHRVINPERGEASNKARMSLVFFQQPNDDAVISCIPSCQGRDNPPRYAPVTAGEYVTAKQNKAWVGKNQGYRAAGSY
jgi:isopenicillin N synthase-like dioxygenase